MTQRSQPNQGTDAPRRRAIDDLANHDKLPEVVIGVVRPQGVDTEKQTQNAFEDLLVGHNFHIVRIDVSDQIRAIANESMLSVPDPADLADTTLRDSSEYNRISDLMWWGNLLRQGVHPAVGAMLAIRAIRMRRELETAKARKGNHRGIAYLVRTLVQPQEVALLRTVYSRRFFLIGLHQNSDSRRASLMERLKKAGEKEGLRASHATTLMAMDEGKVPHGSKLAHVGMNVLDTFPLADVFASAGKDHTDSRSPLKRFVDQLFGNPHGSPTIQEFGMASAFLAARQSSALGRAVGSALLSPDGSVIALGWNDIARPGGGLFRATDDDSQQDHKRGFDPSDSNRITMIWEFIQGLFSITPDQLETSRDEILELEQSGKITTATLQNLSDRFDRLEQLISAYPDDLDVDRTTIKLLAMFPNISALRVMNVIEFGRTVHAEMAAIAEAGRSGFPTAGTHLFVTTFPCHECARNIVAHGIASVTYIQPYAKSMAPELYDGLIDFKSEPVDFDRLIRTDESERRRRGRRDEKVVFAPFEGISPNRFEDLYSQQRQKYSIRDTAVDSNLPEGGSVQWKANSSFILRDSVLGYSDVDFDKYMEAAFELAEQSALVRFEQLYQEFLAGREEKESVS